MKESIYNITVSDTPSAGWKTIYNLLTKEYVCIRNDIQLNDSLPESYIQSLLHKGILILDSSEEVPSRFMRKFICRLRLNEVSRQ